MKVFIRILASFIVTIFILIGIFAWKVYKAQQPFRPDDVPQWNVKEVTTDEWILSSVDDPERYTQAWFIGNPNGKRCDTTIMLGGVQQGRNLIEGGQHLPDHANMATLRHPVQAFLKTDPRKNWGWLEWWQSPRRLRLEIAHTLGALEAMIRYIHEKSRSDPRFTENILLAGGSFGAPFPVILTSFQPERIAALMIAYGFTNFEFVITSELIRQGLIHYRLTESSDSFPDQVKVTGVKLLAHSFGFLFGNMFKYAQMELYLPNIYDTYIYFISGRNDHIVPREAYDPMWNSAPFPKEEEWVEGDHINPGNFVEFTSLVERMSIWAKSKNLWTCEG